MLANVLRAWGSRDSFRNLLENLNLHLEIVLLGMGRRSLTEMAVSVMYQFRTNHDFQPVAAAVP